MISSSEDAAYKAALKQIALELQSNTRALRKLTFGWAYLKHWRADSLSFTYGFVRHPAEKGSDLESFVIFADIEMGGSRKKRFLEGFQIGAGNEIHTIPEKLLTTLGSQ